MDCEARDGRTGTCAEEDVPPVCGQTLMAWGSAGRGGAEGNAVQGGPRCEHSRGALHSGADQGGL